jgi:DedD protein
MAEPPDINVDELRRRARRRLLGAIVLALAAAVIVPMLLESDPKPLGEDVSVKIPPEDNAKFVNRLSDKGAKTSGKEAAAKSEPAKEPAPAEPAPASPAPAPAAPAPTAPAEGATTSSTTSTMPAAKKSLAQAEQKVLGAQGKPATASAAAPAAETVAAPAALPTPVPSVAPPPLADPNRDPNKDANRDSNKDGFSVQLAAFADDKGANALANKLKRAAYPAYTEPLTTSRGTLWRVRVGPYPSRDAAIEVRDRLKGEGYSGIVAAAK